MPKMVLFQKRPGDVHLMKIVNAATQNQDVKVNNSFPIDKYLQVHQPDIELGPLFGLTENKCTFSAQDELLLKNLQKLLQSTAEELLVLSNHLTQRPSQVTAQKQSNAGIEDRKNHARKIVDAKFYGENLGVKPETKAGKIKKQDNITKVKDFNTDGEVSSKKSQTVKTKNRSSGKSVDFPEACKSKNVSVQTSFMKENTDQQTKDNVTDQKIKDTELTPSTNKVNEKKEINSITKQFMVNEKYLDSKKISIGYVEILKGEDVIKSGKKGTEGKFNRLEIQAMPSVDIKTELTTQKIPSLEIKPILNDIVSESKKSNTTFIAYQYVEPGKHNPEKNYVSQIISAKAHHSRHDSMKTVEPINERETDLTNSQSNVVKLYKEALDFLHKSQIKDVKKKTDSGKKKFKKHVHCTVHEVIADKWKKKRKQLHATASTSTLKDNLNGKQKNISNNGMIKNRLTGTDYIPYSKLTLGGVKVTEIEKELLSISSNKGDIPLSPIVNKILGSADTSLLSEVIATSLVSEEKTSNSTSDENLIQEVLSLGEDIKKTIQEYSEINEDQSKSIEKNEIISRTFTRSKSLSDPDKTNNTYDDDDFEEENNSQNNSRTKKNTLDIKVQRSTTKRDTYDASSSQSENVMDIKQDNLSMNLNNLSLKNNVDIFEYLHSVTTQDSATQIRASKAVSLKETQTTPREDNSSGVALNIFSGTNKNLKSVTFDNDYIKNLVREECGNLTLLSREIASFSKNTETEYSNVVKNTQTSPMHIKHTMTSPTHVVNKSTSPFEIVSDDSIKKKNKNDLQEDIISVNLSSPRFKLKLPQSSQEVLSNLNSATAKLSLDEKKSNLYFKHQESLHKLDTQNTKASSDSCEDASPSDISSLGEVDLNSLRRKFSRKNRMETTSESSTTSNTANSLELHREQFRKPARSDGEISLGQV